MLKELRTIWTEDQYELLEADPDQQKYYFGRYKGLKYQVFLRNPNLKKRSLIQSIESNKQLFWNSQHKRMVDFSVENMVGINNRREHILKGYEWCESIWKHGLLDLSQMVKEIKVVLPSGAEAIFLLPKKSNLKWILSLHGGPESYEGLEIRYGGLYRELLQNGLGIVILNYRGSTNLEQGVSRSVWGSWSRAIMRDFSELLLEIKNVSLDKKPVVIFGTSFGGCLALSLQKKFRIHNVVLSSPLLDLENQIRRGKKRYSAWFNSRFSKRDIQNFSYSRLRNSNYGMKYIYYSLSDEVLGINAFKKLEREPRKDWVLVGDATTHAPKSYIEVKKRFNKILETILSCSI